MAYIEVKHLYKRYHMGENVIEANRDVNFEIEKGELVIILGTSERESRRCSTSWAEWTSLTKEKSLSMAPTLQDLMIENERTIEETTSVLSFSSIIWLPI